MAIEISVAISVISVCVAVWSFVRNGKKDVADNATTLARIEVKLDTVVRQCEESNDEIKQHRGELVSHGERIVSVEASSKQAHKRLDDMERRIKQLEERL